MADGNERKRVAIVGHSYIRRLEEVVRGQNNFMRLDLNIGEAQTKWFFHGGWTFGRFKREAFEEVVSWAPYLVYLEIGTCDVDSDDHVSIVGMNALNLAHELLKRGVGRVIFGSVLRREGKYHLPVGQFNCKAVDYNDFMLGCVTNPGEPKRSNNRFKDNRIWFWVHRGFNNSAKTLFKRDGIHLSEEVGCKRLYESIQKAVAKGVH